MHRFVRFRVPSFLLATLIVAAACRDPMAPRAAVAAPYLLTDLTLTDPPTGEVIPVQINDRGQILSDVLVPIIGGDEGGYSLFYLWSAGTHQQLPCRFGANLMENGDVVCDGQLWSNGSLRAIALPDTTVTAQALSPSGEVAGNKACVALPHTNVGDCVVVYWHGQMFQPLGDSASWSPQIADSTGEVLFQGGSGTPAWFRFNPANGTVTRLDGGPNFGASHINAWGQIVGEEDFPPSARTGAVYIHGDTTRMLDTADANAVYINNRGDIIGWANEEPVLWPRGGKRISLLHPTADTAWTVWGVYAIDDYGRIVAIARHDTTTHTVLLTPPTLSTASPPTP